jgi:hypothetical protein
MREKIPTDPPNSKGVLSIPGTLTAGVGLLATKCYCSKPWYTHVIFCVVLCALHIDPL